MRAGGEYLEAREWWGWTAFAAIAVTILLSTLVALRALRGSDTLWPAAFVVTLIVLATVKRSVRRIARSIRRVRKGRAGERLVSHLVARLSDDYYLINDVVLARGNADHVVVGPCGILVLETKNVRGHVDCHGDDWTVNGGQVRSYSKQAKAAAIALRNRLGGRHPALQDEYVEAAVVLVDPFCRVTVRDPKVRVVRFSEVLPLVASLSTKRQMPGSRAEIIASALAQS